MEEWKLSSHPESDETKAEGGLVIVGAASTHRKPSFCVHERSS